MNNDIISRRAAIDELVRWDKISDYNDGERNMIACCIAMLSALPPASEDCSNIREKVTIMKDDTISRQAVLDAVEGVDWYHQNKNGEMVHGANSDEHQAWYKADDVYTAIESVPSAQLAQDLPKGCTDTISRQAAIDAEDSK